MILPHVHLNGTSKRDLLEGWLKMSHALDAALTVMRHEGPNARDYYVQGPEAWPVARAEHEARYEAVKRVKAEIDLIVEWVADQEGGRP